MAEKFRINLTVKKGGRSKSTSFFAEAGQSLLDSIENNVRKTRVKDDARLGPELVKIFNIKKSRKSGVEFRIDGKIPYAVEKSGEKLYLSLYHIEVRQDISLQIELVGVNCDFSNSVVDPRLDFRAHEFRLEELPDAIEGGQTRYSSQFRNQIEAWWLHNKFGAYPKSIPAKPIGHASFGFFGGSSGQHSKIPNPERASIPFWKNELAAPEGETLRAASVHLQPGAINLPVIAEGIAEEGAFAMDASDCGNGWQPQDGGQQGNAASANRHDSLRCGATYGSKTKKGEKLRRKTKLTKQPAPSNGADGRRSTAVPLSSIKKLRAVIFDMDGVVINSMELHRKSFNDLLAPLGIRVAKKGWGKYGGIHSEAIIRELFQKHGIKESARTWNGSRTLLYGKYLHKYGVPPINGFHETYDYLSKNRIKMSVASSGEESHVRDALRSIRAGKMPFVTIQHVRKGKPSPDLFLLAAKRLKVKPSECLVIEDAPSGMEAAMRAGMPCIALSTTFAASALRGKAAAVFRDYKAKKFRRLLSQLISKGRRDGKKRAQSPMRAGIRARR